MSTSQASFEDILKREDLSYWDVLSYLREQLLEFDADAPFEPPTIPQVGWVFERVNANERAQGSFRALIYGEMGFDESAYSPLYTAGGMNICNAMYREYHETTGTASDEVKADLEAEAEEEAFVADPRNKASLVLQYLLKEESEMTDEERLYWLILYRQAFVKTTEERLRRAYRLAQLPEAQTHIDALDTKFRAWLDTQEKEERELEGSTDAT